MSDVSTLPTAAEQVRVSALHAYDILDTPAERDFDDIVSLAAHLCGTPIALVSLVDTDRQWFKARIGVEACQTSRESSFCAHAMQGETVMQVPDARLDPRFADNPFVLGDPHVRFYAGAPLISPAGQPLGSLCVIDRKPGLLTPAQCEGLLTLARHVVGLLELRQHAANVEAGNRRLREADRLKDEFISRITHELRTPLTSINGYLEVLEDDLLAHATATFLERIRRNFDRLLTLVDDMLLTAKATTESATLNRHHIDVAAMARGSVARHRALAESKGLTITTDADTPVIAYADEQQLARALDRLVHNAVQFTDRGGITVTATDGDGDGGHAVITVHDTGVGFPAEQAARLFEPFRRGEIAERREVQGAGLGLSLVRSLIQAHGGTIALTSATGSGTTATLTLPRHTAEQGPCRDPDAGVG